MLKMDYSEKSNGCISDFHFSKLARVEKKVYDESLLFLTFPSLSKAIQRDSLSDTCSSTIGFAIKNSVQSARSCD